MKKEDVKLGLKIKIPNVIRTADGIALKNCSAYDSMNRKEQDFLFITRVHYNDRPDVVEVGAKLGDIESSFYIKDLQPYSRQIMLFEDEL